MKHLTKSIAAILALIFAVTSFCYTAFAAKYIEAGTNGNTPASESYQRSKYYTYLTDTPLTGDNPTDVIAIALSQLGYKEGNNVDTLGGLSSGDKNFSEYNRNFGDFSNGYGYDWCAAFVSFCLLQAECHHFTKLKDWCRDHTGDPHYIWRELGCEKWRSALSKVGYFRTSPAYKNSTRLDLDKHYDESYTPTAGDLIFFTRSAYNTSSHIGIVLYVDGDTVYTVEGNTSPRSGLEGNGDGVYIKSYDMSDSFIVGYGDMPYKTDASVQKPDYSGDSPTCGIYMSTQKIHIFNTPTDAQSKSALSAPYTLPRYCMLTVDDISDDGIFYVKCIINGQRIQGYTKLRGCAIQTSCDTVELNIPIEVEDGDLNLKQGLSPIASVCIAIFVILAVGAAVGIRFLVKHIRKKRCR